MDYFSSLQEQHKEFLINSVSGVRLRICHLQMNDDYDAAPKYFWKDSFSDGISRLRTGMATLESAACLLYPYKYLDSERDSFTGSMVFLFG